MEAGRAARGVSAPFATAGLSASPAAAGASGRKTFTVVPRPGAVSMDTPPPDCWAKP